MLGEANEVMGQVRPGLTAVFGTHDAIDLECGINLVRAGRVLHHALDARIERGLAVFFDVGTRQFGPGRATVVAAVDIDG